MNKVHVELRINGVLMDLVIIHTDDNLFYNRNIYVMDLLYEKNRIA